MNVSLPSSLVATVLAGLSTVAVSAGGPVEVETFNGGAFTNPFFVHDFEYDCCWSFVFRDESDSEMLHLVPNNDLVVFDLAPDEYVREIRVDILDFEGGFVGDSPTSAAVVRAASGDFVALHATEIGTLEVVSATEDTPGQLDGLPLTQIVSVRFDAANEGNSEFPTEIGGYFDNVTVVLGARTPGDVNLDGAVDFTDLLTILADWGACPAPGGSTCTSDADRDGSVGFGDVLLVLANWSP